MINQWNDIDLEMFKELFDFYRNHGGGSKDKVIEIQSLSGQYYEEDPCTRIFLGSKINPFDYRKWNESICTVFESFKDTIDIEDDLEMLNLCFFAPRRGYGPLITPLGATEKNVYNFWAASFGDMSEVENSSLKNGIYSRLILWFTKDANGKIVYDMSRKPTKFSLTERLVRVRIMDFSDWKKMVSEALESDRIPEYFSSSDIKKEDFGKVIEGD